MDYNQRLSKHSLDLNLSDRVWFRFSTFYKKPVLQADSNTKLMSIPGLAVLSGGAEFLFFFMTIAIAVMSLVLQEMMQPISAFVTSVSCYLCVFFTKRIMIYNKFGFGRKWVMSISKDSLEIDRQAVKGKASKILHITKDDIKEIVFNYTFHGRSGRIVDDKTANLHACEIHQKDGKVVTLDNMRVGLFDVLYLLKFYQYPLFFKGTTAGGAGNIVILIMRLISLSAIISALVMLAFNLKS
ncbi:hypothetical protein HYD28_14485 [Pseudoalteromonas shioyasakiensis]|nr:hypothetical protein HYD28_14485 [Pseudoalteromonas shioyasakiensis]